MKTRRSGILLHISSLPSPGGIGDMGPWARRFADFLAESGQSVWQILPLNPTSSICGSSPYSSHSAFAGNPLLISLELMAEEGFLHPSDLENTPLFPAEKVDFEAVTRHKLRLLRSAAERFAASPERRSEFEAFCSDHSYWLEDYALFTVLKEDLNGAPWYEWPAQLKHRQPQALQEWRDRLAERISMEKFFQFVFFKQWLSLKASCNDRNIRIIGDIPIYVSHDSADVWAGADLFKLDEERNRISVAGVPPDYFSATGQLWGNPVYRWDRLADTGYAFWLKRFEHNLKLFDMVRLDHFRGFVAYWEIPAAEKTAVNGRWVEAPVRSFFDTLKQRFPNLPIIAEDLGIITPDVREVMAAYGFPGMKLLHFAFGEDLPTNPYAPHNLTVDSLVYTGTHDNNTTRGWFANDLSDEEKSRLSRYLGKNLDEESVSWELIRTAMMSVCAISVIPMQDILSLGPDARMNQPSVTYGNWEWRLLPEQLTPNVTEKLLEMTRLYGRTQERSR